MGGWVGGRVGRITSCFFTYLDERVDDEGQEGPQVRQREGEGKEEGDLAACGWW